MEPIEEWENDNGLILNSVYFPEEVIAYILSYVDAKSLVSQCRKVCKSWRFLIDTSVWKILVRSASDKHSFSKLSYIERIHLNLPWHVYYAVFKYDPFERNLLQNNSAQEKTKFWDLVPPDYLMLHTRRGGTGPTVLRDGYWQIEETPTGCEPMPASEDFGGRTSCFVTSYNLCSMSQLIKLKDHGITDIIMDELRPIIMASEWFAGRFDCGFVYKLTISLLDEKKELLYEKTDGTKKLLAGQGTNWQKVEYILDNYKPGVRYIKFAHEGKDTQFWAGHYGSKMAGGVVKVLLPQAKDNGESISLLSDI